VSPLGTLQRDWSLPCVSWGWWGLRRCCRD